MSDTVAVSKEQDGLVAAYWRYHAGSSGDRIQRLAAQGSVWAASRADEVMRTGTIVEALDLLEALLMAPTADSGYVGAGPLETLLIARPEVDVAVARRCQQSVASTHWRDAVASVWLSRHERSQLPALEDRLGPALPGD